MRQKPKGTHYGLMSAHDSPYECDQCDREECNLHEHCDDCGTRHTTCEGWREFYGGLDDFEGVIDRDISMNY